MSSKCHGPYTMSETVANCPSATRNQSKSAQRTAHLNLCLLLNFVLRVGSLRSARLLSSLRAMLWRNTYGTSMHTQVVRKASFCLKKTITMSDRSTADFRSSRSVEECPLPLTWFTTVPPSCANLEGHLTENWHRRKVQAPESS